MKIWRNIWVILLLIIVFLGVPFLWMNWDDIQKRVMAFGEQNTGAESNKKQPGETGEQKKKDAVEDAGGKKPEAKQSVVKAEKKSNDIEPVFEGADLKTGKDGRLIGFAPKGWGVRVKRGERVIAKTIANKDDGRWVIILDKNSLPKGRSVLSMEVVSPGNKIRAMAGQKLELIVPEASGAAIQVVRLEKGKDPVVIQKAEEKKVAPKTASVAGDEKKVSEAKVDATDKKSSVKTRGGKTTDVATKRKEPKGELLVVDHLEFKNLSAKGGVLELQGEGLPGNLLKIYVDNQELGVVRVDSNGKWRFSKTVKAAGGKVRVKVEQVDGKGAVVAVKERGYDVPVLTASVKTKDKTAAKVPISKERSGKKPSAAADKTAMVERREKTVEIKEAASKDRDEPVMHRVVRGDTLWGIAVKHYGDGISYWKIYRKNKKKIKKPDLIYPGQNFIIP